MSSPTHDAAGDDRPGTLEEWWAGLGAEEQYHVIELVRFDQTEFIDDIETRFPAPEPLTSGKKPSPALSEFVRTLPAYQERYAVAEKIAVDDGANIPDSHLSTDPLEPDDRA